MMGIQGIELAWLGPASRGYLRHAGAGDPNPPRPAPR
jgi:hypothetical protein